MSQAAAAPRRLWALAVVMVLEGGFGPAAHAAPLFHMPIACRVGDTCWIQKYVDTDAGAGFSDHQCGRLSNDGHKGTDFRLATQRDLARDVAVLAAADGRVRAVRDGMPDISVNRIGLDALNGRDAGNSVVIDHGDGWATQYAHLKLGSVAVMPGARVRAGDVIGTVGLSGRTEFPHVHFEVRRDGDAVDPFTGQTMGTECRAPARPLWSPAAAQALDYRPSAVLDIGFALFPPVKQAARAGAYHEVPLSAGSSMLLLWADAMGVKAGDRQQFIIATDDGRRLLDRTLDIDAAKAAWFAYAGLRRPPAGWPEAPLVGTYRLNRSGRLIDERTLTIEGLSDRAR